MWSALLNAVGWMFFYALIVSYVWWAIMEQKFFACEDPESWENPLASDESRTDHRYHVPAWGYQVLHDRSSA